MDEIIKERMLRRLRISADEKWGQLGDRYKVLRDIYLTETDCCIHDDYISDDVMSDIINKYYWVLEAIREEFDPFIEVYVIPSYEDDTSYFMIYESKLLVKGHIKAWNFWWETEEELMDFMYEIYCQISKCLTESIISPKKDQDSWEPDIAIVIEGGIISSLVTRGERITYRVIDIDALKNGEDRFMEDSKADDINVDIENYSDQITASAKGDRHEKKTER